MDNCGPRGEMRAIPIDSARRIVSLRAIEKLIAGKVATRCDLFESDPVDKVDRYWQPRLIRRMLKDGALACSSTYNHRMYWAGNLERLKSFRKLLEEKDPALQARGYRGVFQIDKLLRDVLDGILLGDGHYTKLEGALHGSSLRVEQRHDRVEWLEWIGGNLRTHGVDFSIAKKSGKEAPAGKDGRRYKFDDISILRTKSYWTFSVERTRWYPTDSKRVPRDLDLSSAELLAQWYMGDGSISQKAGKIVLCTDGFLMEDVLWLKSQFKGRLSIGCSVGLYSGKPRICISGVEAEKFIEIVRPHILKTFSYKMQNEWKHKMCSRCKVPILNRSRRADFCDKCSYGSEKRRRLDLASR